jgi:molecular chaperone DnaK (HSP70)
VSAEAKGTGNAKKVTINNEKGRLSEAEIKRMVEEAEQFKEQDERLRKRVHAKNDLEGYCFSLRNSLEKVPDNQREGIRREMEECLRWIDENGELEVEAYENKRKEVEEKVERVMRGEATSGPRVEEVD